MYAIASCVTTRRPPPTKPDGRNKKKQKRGKERAGEEEDKTEREKTRSLLYSPFLPLDLSKAKEKKKSLSVTACIEFEKTPLCARSKKEKKGDTQTDTEAQKSIRASLYKDVWMMTTTTRRRMTANTVYRNSREQS